MVKLVIAIVTGLLVGGALSFGADTVLQRVAPDSFSPAGKVSDGSLLLLIAFYTTLSGAAGAYLATFLTKERPTRVSVLIGVIGLLIVIPVVVQQRDLAPGWFYALTLGSVLPVAWAVGYVRERQLARRTAMRSRA